MIEESGTIIDVKGRTAMIRTERGTSCESCVSRQTCHGKIGTNEVIVEAENAANAKVGDRVVLMVGTSTLLKASLVLYLGPVAGLIIGVVIGQLIAKQFNLTVNPDLLSGILGAMFLIIAFFGIRLYGKWLAKKEGLKPVVVRVL